MNSYNLYKKENYSKIKNEYPKLTFLEVDELLKQKYLALEKEEIKSLKNRA